MAQEREVSAATAASERSPSDDATTRIPIVAFDFDGTMTVRDSYTAFLRWRTPTAKWVLGGLRLIPAYVSFLFHQDRGRIKAAATKVFLGGVRREQLEAEARRFAEQHSRRLLRPDAVAAWKNWRKERVRLIIVTASPETVVAPFARGLAADALLATPLAFDPQDRVTGGFERPNNRGPEKEVRLREAYGDDVHIRAAYGDTDGDTEMLAMAEEPYYRVFTGRP